MAIIALSIHHSQLTAAWSCAIMMAHADGDGRRIFIRQSVTTENPKHVTKEDRREI